MSWRALWLLAAILAGVAASIFFAVGTTRARGGSASAAAAGTVEHGPEVALGELGRILALRDDPAIERQDLPRDIRRPTNAQELAEYVAWLRSLGQDELLRASNAEFDFQESELVEVLQRLQGEWVVPALGELALAESDPLLRAVLIVGLCYPDFERRDDERLVPIVASLVAGMVRASDDPYEIAGRLVFSAQALCVSQGQDYMALIGRHLAAADNPELLVAGYLFLGSFPGAEAELEGMLTGHASAEGRFGALEGLRNAATRGRIAPETVTALGLAALESETNERNRLLLYEMMISTGGDGALDAVEARLRAGETTEVDETVEMLAMKMDPDRARALFADLLRDGALDDEAKQATYRAMGMLPGEEGARFLLDLARNGALDAGERLAGLRGLWNRAVDEELAAELQSVLEGEEDPALRTEALRMLVYGESEGKTVDLRQIAALDDDPGVRAEAVQLAAMQPSGNTREWLEERLLQDDSVDVKAAALGALVYQAHYGGDGDAVLGYLARARKFTDDEAALAMIAEGERMVIEHDPRKLELGLAKEAEFWSTLAGLTDGPASRAFDRDAKHLSRIVATLRETQAGRRPAR